MPKVVKLCLMCSIVSTTLFSCVSNQKYKGLLQDKDRLDVNVERAHKEIRDLKETKIVLEDQIKYKNTEITKLEAQVNSIKKQADTMDKRFSELDEQMKKMSTELEHKRSESAQLVASYEKKITELQQWANKLKTKKKARKK